MERIVVSTLESSAKFFSHWTSTDLEIWVENGVFTIQYLENSKDNGMYQGFSYD